MAGVIRRVRGFVPTHWGRLVLLIILCALPAGLEAGLGQYGAGFTATTQISPQASALWPYDTFHDVRWVMVYHNSWAGFVGESAAAIVLRGLFCTVLTALAWPHRAERPSLRRLTTRHVAFAAGLGAFLSPWAAMSVVVSDVSLAWYLFGAILPLLIMAPFLQRGAMVPNWWRGLPPAGTFVLSIVNFATLTTGSAVVAAVPDGWRVAVAMAVGGVNGLLWYWAVRVAVLAPPMRWRHVPVTPIVVAVVIALMFTAGRVSGVTGAGGPGQEPPTFTGAEAKALNRPVIFLGGFTSRYDGRPNDPPAPIVQYSYRGLDPDGRPRPYSATDTHQSVVTSARLLAAQVDHVHRATGRKVALVGESEGTLIIQYYLKTDPHRAVDTVALLSPVLRAGRVYYPPRDRVTGWGVATGWELRGIFAVLGAASRLPNSADLPLVRSILDNAPLFRGRQLLCATEGVRKVAFVATLDALANPPGAESEIPVVETSGIHGMLSGDPAVRQRLVEFLNTGRVQPQRRWDYRAGQYAGAAWQTPALRVDLNPAWRNVAGYLNRDYRAAECL